MSTEATTKMLTLDEVAARLNVARRSVQQWIYDKELGSFNKGERRRVSEADLAEFVLKNSIKPRRPEWLSGDVESAFVEKLKDLVKQEFNAEAQRRAEVLADGHA